MVLIVSLSSATSNCDAFIFSNVFACTLSSANRPSITGFIASRVRKTRIVGLEEQVLKAQIDR